MAARSGNVKIDSLMNPHEEAFVETFIHPDQRDRFLAALNNPQKRDVFNRELHHPKAKFLLSRYIEQIVPSQQHTRSLAPKLRSMGARDDCWVFGNYIDSRQMKLEEALDALVGMRSGTIIFLPARQTCFFRERRRTSDSPQSLMQRSW